ncbi:kinesin [Sclerotinia borealis F-4128]|uniref:Kinesin n=1 Tax=Sclerotinia borealis (strain F-4128) TaxID=1432307 RepID=W9C2R7_SCLBF|nr:kinesin [Sclerotinia borealis F-4128]
MEYQEENQYSRTSQPKPTTSAIPSLGKPLAEITDSHGNTRSRLPSKMPQPTTLKRQNDKSSNEPAAKRKTLIDRAGEPATSAMIRTPSVRKLPPVKGTTLVDMTNNFTQLRNTSHSSSISSQTPSASSRHTSSSSFSQSVGPGRPKSAYGQRPPSQSQSTTSRPNTSQAKGRPNVSKDSTSSDDDGMPPPGGRRRPMLPVPAIASSSQLNGDSGLEVMKVRGHCSTNSMRSLRSQEDLRDLSVSTALSRLKVNDEQTSPSTGYNLSSSPRKNSRPRHMHSQSLGYRSMRLDNEEAALVLYEAPDHSSVAPKTPSHIPVLAKSGFVTPTPVTPCQTSKLSPTKTPFLTKDSNVHALVAFDVRGRLETMEAMYTRIESTLTGTNKDHDDLKVAVGAYKAKLDELEGLRTHLTSSNQILQTNLDDTTQRLNMIQQRLLEATTTLDDNIRAHRLEMDDVNRNYRNETDKMRRDNTDELDRLLRTYRNNTLELERKAAVELDDRVRILERQNDAKLEEERKRRLREVQELENQVSTGHQGLNLALQMKEQEVQMLKKELEELKTSLGREKELKDNALNTIKEVQQIMQNTGVETSATIGTLESTVASLRARIHFLESGSKAQSDSFVEMEGRLQEALDSAEESKKKLIKEETLRRILFNQVQELKGNIRVMCRVRPTFKEGVEGECAKLSFPDTDKESKELSIIGKEKRSNFGKVTTETHAFSFDRVFGPTSQNQEVFEEISQLVQSALDGYNVCIFAYGQTGAGKTHTMSSADGMIPRATHQIYESAELLKEKGWTYTMEGSFVEVYNEEIHDLLGSSKDLDKKKHEIRHDDKKKQTTVTGLEIVSLDSPNAVEAILKQADKNRSVAATKSNERSSRSHSVFILKLVGRNSTTNETSEGTLNLVDLAGSERLKVSGAEGERMKETQNINKSLSCLGDVIGALGSGKEGAHIPYRNSKLTYLLQYSLGGNSKTLMFVMASPLEAHLGETLTSLKFATKVHNTHIGTAKNSIKVRD